jgi:hypothetical protein
MECPTVKNMNETISIEKTEDLIEKKSTYSESHRKYYQAHKKEIYQKDYEKGKYKRRYERKKEELKAKALARYYRRKEAKLIMETKNLTDANPESPALSLSA